MKKLLFLAAFVTILSCNSKSKTLMTKPDTVYTQILFKNLYGGIKPFAPVLTAAIRIIKDTPTIDGDHVTHKLDTMYFVGYTRPVPDPKDSTHKKSLKSMIDPNQDSLALNFYPIIPAYVIVDYNATDPFITPSQPVPPSPLSTPPNQPQEIKTHMDPKRDPK